MKKFIRRIKIFVKKTIKFVTDGIWKKGEDEYGSKALRFIVRQLKILLFTAKSYGKDQLIIRSAALTFYTMMAIVPFAAIIFGIAKGFMFENSISAYLYAKFPNYTGLVSQIIEFANALLERTKGGIIAIIGVLVLMWAVIKVFINIESSFNHIWEIRKSRSFTRKLSDYLSVLLVAPIFWFVTNNASNVIGTSIDNAVSGTIMASVVDLLGYLLPWLIISIMLTVVYFVMPNTKVRFRSAVSAAVIAAAALYIFQTVYFYSQTRISNYNAIYGSFAALPLFLIWLNISWQIIMFGAEMSFGYQNIEKYEFERETYKISLDYKRKIMLVVMHRIASNFEKGKRPMDDEQIAKAANLPVRIVRDVLYDLEQANLVVSLEDEQMKSLVYLPMRNVSKMKIYDVIKTVESAGVQNFNIQQYEDLKSVNKIVSDLDNIIAHSDKNIPLMDIPD
ncbi:MAG: YihY/virulence factor BrkB family protein [Rikenellaceae bacterium]|nr:YihY/virulence factor BrkB family protein [Rikenellaceae bacterium]